MRRFSLVEEEGEKKAQQAGYTAVRGESVAVKPKSCRLKGFLIMEKNSSGR